MVCFPPPGRDRGPPGGSGFQAGAPGPGQRGFPAAMRRRPGPAGPPRPHGAVPRARNAVTRVTRRRCCPRWRSSPCGSPGRQAIGSTFPTPTPAPAIMLNPIQHQKSTETCSGTRPRWRRPPHHRAPDSATRVWTARQAETARRAATLALRVAGRGRYRAVNMQHAAPGLDQQVEPPRSIASRDAWLAWGICPAPRPISVQTLPAERPMVRLYLQVHGVTCGGAPSSNHRPCRASSRAAQPGHPRSPPRGVHRRC